MRGACTLKTARNAILFSGLNGIRSHYCLEIERKKSKQDVFFRVWTFYIFFVGLLLRTSPCQLFLFRRIHFSRCCCRDRGSMPLLTRRSLLSKAAFKNVLLSLTLSPCCLNRRKFSTEVIFPCQNIY